MRQFASQNLRRKKPAPPVIKEINIRVFNDTPHYHNCTISLYRYSPYYNKIIYDKRNIMNNSIDKAIVYTSSLSTGNFDVKVTSTALMPKIEPQSIILPSSKSILINITMSER